MSGLLEARGTKIVGVDHATLRMESTAGDATRYAVELLGPVDDRWARAYREVQAEATAFRRFRFDPASRSVSFSCRTIDGPADVMEVLERLDALVRLVNQRVSGGETL